MTTNPPVPDSALEMTDEQKQEKAEKLFQEAEGLYWEASKYFSSGDKESARVKYEEALKIIKEALKVGKVVLVSKTKVSYLQLKARILWFLDIEEEALMSIEEALELGKELLDSKTKANYLELKASILWSFDRNKEALKIIEEALTVGKEVLDLKIKASYLELKARILRDLKRYNDALMSIEEALTVGKEVLDSKTKAKYLELKTRILYDLENYDDALKAIEEALELGKEVLDSKTKASYWELKARILWLLDRDEEALKALEEAWELGKEVLDLETKALYWGLKARILWILDRDKEALEAIEETLTVGKEVLVSKTKASYLELKAKILLQAEKWDLSYNACQQGLGLDFRKRSLRELFLQVLDKEEVKEYLEREGVSAVKKVWANDADFLSLLDEKIWDKCTHLDNVQSINKIWALQYKMLDLLQVEGETYGVAHYTALSTLEILWSKKDNETMYNPLKLFSVAGANDKAEGRAFMSFLGDSLSCQHSPEEEQMAVLQCSFSSEIDCLNQFRLYGRKSHSERESILDTEGTGVCLVFNQAFFASKKEEMKAMVGAQDRTKFSFKAPDNLTIDTTATPVQSSKSPKSIEEIKLPLYYVLYYDESQEGRIIYSPAYSDFWVDEENEERTGKVKERYKDIKKVMDEIKGTFNSLKDNPDLQKMVLNMLIYLRHLIKHSAFKEEKELRIIQLLPYGDSSIELISRLNDFPRLSSNYLPILHEDGYLEKVIMGPKVEKFRIAIDFWKNKITNAPRVEKIRFFQSQAPLN